MLLLRLVPWSILVLPLMSLGIGGIRGVEHRLGYIGLPLMASAIFLNARFFPRWSFPICYGIICGWLYGSPDYFYMRGSNVKIWMVYGHILIYVAITQVVCLTTFGYWLKLRRERHP